MESKNECHTVTIRVPDWPTTVTFNTKDLQNPVSDLDQVEEPRLREFLKDDLGGRLEQMPMSKEISITSNQPVDWNGGNYLA